MMDDEMKIEKEVSEPAPPQVSGFKNRLPGAIVSAALVAGPIGIAGIIYAAKALMGFKRGDYVSASYLNRKAKRWIRFGLWLGVVSVVTILILYIAFLVVMFEELY